jgi:hypothetical protein
MKPKNFKERLTWWFQDVSWWIKARRPDKKKETKKEST